MKESELRRALVEEFGEAYSGVIVRDHWLRDMGATAAELLERGENVRDVWLAICNEFDIPVEKRHGRGISAPKRDR